MGDGGGCRCGRTGRDGKVDCRCARGGRDEQEMTVFDTNTRDEEILRGV